MSVTERPTRPAPIEADRRRRALRLSVLEGASAQAHSALTGLGVNGNAFTFGFAIFLGAGDLALGLCAAVPALASTAQLISAALLDRLGSRRRAVVWASTLARASWLVCGALPFLVADRRLALALFLCLWATSSALLSFSGNLWVSWMADLVPERLRARYFALRANVCNLAGTAAGLSAGWALDRWAGGVAGPAPGPLFDAADRSRAWGFLALFGLATLAGLVCAWLLRAQPEPARDRAPPRPDEGGGLRRLLLLPFAQAARTPGLRGLLLFVGLFGVTNGLAAPFWTPYQLQDLRMDYTTVNGLLVIIQGIAMTVAFPLWGHVGARAGNKVVVALTVALCATHPLYYLIATPERHWPIYLDSFSAGLAWSGYNVAVFNLALSLAAGPHRERLFAVYATVAGVAMALSSALSGLLADRLPPVVHLASLEIGPRQTVFLVTSVARALCLLVLLAVVTDPRRPGLRPLLASIPYLARARMDLFRFLVRERRPRA